jgi:hypothetical protein
MRTSPNTSTCCLPGKSTEQAFYCLAKHHCCSLLQLEKEVRKRYRSIPLSSMTSTPSAGGAVKKKHVFTESQTSLVLVFFIRKRNGKRYSSIPLSPMTSTPGAGGTVMTKHGFHDVTMNRERFRSLLMVN